MTTYCKNEGIAQCTTESIDESLKKKDNVTIMSMYIGTERAGEEGLCAITNCNNTQCKSGDASDACIDFAVASDFNEVKRKAGEISAAVLTSVPSSLVCHGSPLWFFMLALIVPLALYLLWRPISLFIRMHCCRASDEARKRASLKHRSINRQSRHENTSTESGSRTFRWSIKAADAYLWDLSGGATPLGVDFGGVAPPSAPRKDSRNPENYQKRGLMGWEAPSRFDFQEFEVQPGDIDYEYTLCLLRCFPCLRPRRTATRDTLNHYKNLEGGASSGVAHV